MTTHAYTLSRAFPFVGVLLGFVFLLAFLLILMGLNAPALKISSFCVGVCFYSAKYSILDSIFALFQDGQTFLAFLIFTFSVAFPLFKTGLGFIALFTFNLRQPSTHRIISLIRGLSKWSMVDVFAIALIVVVLNGQILTAADIDAGVGMFASGILASSIATFGLEHLIQRHKNAQPQE